MLELRIMKECRVPGLYGDSCRSIEYPYCVFEEAATLHPIPKDVTDFEPMVEKNSQFCPKIDSVRKIIEEIKNR